MGRSLARVQQAETVLLTAVKQLMPCEVMTLAAALVSCSASTLLTMLSLFFLFFFLLLLLHMLMLFRYLSGFTGVETSS